MNRWESSGSGPEADSSECRDENGTDIAFASELELEALSTAADSGSVTTDLTDSQQKK